MIMTQNSTRNRYDMELRKGSVVESNLKNRLVDFMNTEIALGTVNSKSSAIAWIERTFFYIRAGKNPRQYIFFFFPERRVRIRQYAHPTLQNRYNISGESEDDLKRFVSAHVDTIFKRLTISGMCLTDDDQKKQQWISTDTGHLMCRYFLRFETVQQFASFDRDPSKIVKGLKTHSSSDEDDMFRVLLLLSKCYELIEIGIRREEKKPLRNFQGRFEIPHKKGAMDASKKCFQVLQARCAESTGRSISIKALQIQQMQILENANRVRIVRARE